MAAEHPINAAPEEETCCVCMDETDQLILTTCAHLICVGCLQDWLVQRQNCPTCRTEFPARWVEQLQKMKRKAKIVSIGAPVKLSAPVAVVAQEPPQPPVAASAPVPLAVPERVVQMNRANAAAPNFMQQLMSRLMGRAGTPLPGDFPEQAAFGSVELGVWMQRRSHRNWFAMPRYIQSMENNEPSQATCARLLDLCLTMTSVRDQVQNLTNFGAKGLADMNRSLLRKTGDDHEAAMITFTHRDGIVFSCPRTTDRVVQIDVHILPQSPNNEGGRGCRYLSVRFEFPMRMFDGPPQPTCCTYSLRVCGFTDPARFFATVDKNGQTQKKVIEQMSQMVQTLVRDHVPDVVCMERCFSGSLNAEQCAALTNAFPSWLGGTTGQQPSFTWTAISPGKMTVIITVKNVCLAQEAPNAELHWMTMGAPGRAPSISLPGVAVELSPEGLHEIVDFIQLSYSDDDPTIRVIRREWQIRPSEFEAPVRNHFQPERVAYWMRQLNPRLDQADA
jgi:hypothetical protein